MLSRNGSNQKTQIDFEALYKEFDSPFNGLDCGKKCAPYNSLGVPFCCDPQHIIPTAYQSEWEYLENNTSLWELWSDADAQKTEKIAKELPIGQVPIVCLGWEQCQRDYRAITCRTFPFFPYISSTGEFIGLAYYWAYEECCWVISNLHLVGTKYIHEFVTTFETLFVHFPEEMHNYQSHSEIMRRTFEKESRTITVLHRDGQARAINPASEQIDKVDIDNAPKFGPYKIAAQMPFPDEVQDKQ
jgi:hypothetical protein